jgi:hypothetical protein
MGLLRTSLDMSASLSHLVRMATRASSSMSGSDLTV